MGLTFYIAMTVVSITLWLPATTTEFTAFTRDGVVRWTSLGTRKDGRVCMLSVGTVGDRVSFVVISVGPAGGTAVSSHVRSRETYPVQLGEVVRKSIEVTLNIPKEKSVRLPLRAQLIEVVDGEKVQLSDQKVSLAEVKAYMESKTKDWSLNDLLRFVEAQRKRDK
jgi:hypothetical protein